jgi:Spy/CpxP family protein refolding chaperone
MAKELGLSTQQKSQLRELRKEMRDFHRSQMDKMRALRDKSKGELLAASPNKEILYGFAREMGELRRVMAEKEADHLLKVKAVLTPDQFEKLLKMDFGQRKGPGPAGCHDTLQGKWLHGRGPNGGPHHPDMED